MPGFHLHRSNRLESLAGALAERLRVPLCSPLAAETVLVQSQGMARWLKLELARRLGVAANVEFPFPRAFAHGLFRALGFTVDARPSFDPELLVWRLHALLPAVAAEPGFAAVGRYLADGDDRKRFQLAGRLARLFDQYLVYRPELVLAWDADEEAQRDNARALGLPLPAAKRGERAGERGVSTMSLPELTAPSSPRPSPPLQVEEREEATAAGCFWTDEEWQARLWHRVATGWATGHPARWQRDFLERTQAGTLPAGALPERVSVFGISALPPFHLELLAALATVTEVNLFLLQPTEHFWGDLRSRREQALARRQGDPGVPPEEGHPLVASWGRTGREMHDLLLAYDVHDAPEHFTEPAGDTLLERLQAAMNALQFRPDGGDRTPLARADDSLRVHSCHSPLREVEVLRDHLLAWFQDEPELQPRHVVVMVPDLETYAPLLEAVLGQPERPEHALPFTLADRPPRAGGVGAALGHALELAAGDFAAPDVLALLERPVVRQRFGLDDDALARCREWIRAAEIRWGRDARQAAAQSATAGHTWRAGLDRLLLSFAVGGSEEVMACGITRSVAVDGADAETLGGFCQFAGTLLDFAGEAETPVSPAQWETRLKALLTALCVTEGDFLRETEAVNAALATLGDAEKWGRCEEPLSLAVVREHLDQVLGEDRRGSGFLTGGITVCGLRPMRSVPFEIVCVLGLNHGTFPRQHSPLTFDLTARQRRPGDSSPRDDDRYLFLETLLSARRRLHLSYVGQSQRDGKDIPPSVVIGELLDHLDHEFSLPDGRPPSAELVVKHRLQAFSPEYFRGQALFSFSPANFAAAVAVQQSRQQPPPALAGELPLPTTENSEPVELADLARFFRNPARFFAERRLGLRFRRDDEPLAREESFRVDSRDNFHLVEAGVAILRRGGSLRELQLLQAAAGRIPGGALTEGETRRLERETTEFWQSCEPHLRGEVREVSGVVTLAAGLPVLNGRTEVIGGRLARARYSKLESKPEVMLDVWLELLFAAARDGTVTQAVLIGRDQTWQLTAPENPVALLDDLVRLFLRGQTRVLPFAPRTSWAYVEKLLGKVRDEAEREARAREAARKVWAPDFASDRAPDPESADEALALAFNGADLTAEPEFGVVSTAVFEPLLSHREEVA